MNHPLDCIVRINLGSFNSPIPSIVFLLQPEPRTTTPLGVHDVSYFMQRREVGNHALDGFDVNAALLSESSASATDTNLNCDVVLDTQGIHMSC